MGVEAPRACLTEIEKIKEAHRLMWEAEQSMVPAELREKGWQYRDIPGLLTHDAWDLLLALIGDGEYQIVGRSSGKDKHGTPYKRGQFFISPQGFENMKDKERLARLRALPTDPAQREQR